MDNYKSITFIFPLNLNKYSGPTLQIQKWRGHMVSNYADFELTQENFLDFDSSRLAKRALL